MISPELDLKPIHDALQVGLEPDEICIREGIVLKICSESRFPFEFFCWRSPPMVKEMDCFIKYSKGRERLLDVGAFHGLFSLVFWSLGGASTATEPYGPSVKMSLKNSDLNRGVMTLIVEALSDHGGRILMHEECGHLVAEESRQHRHVNAPYKPGCMTGDDLCSLYRKNPDTIKIDVEGHEVKVLRGLQETIQRLRPVIFIEIHLDKLANQGESIKDVADLLPNYEFIYTGTEEKVDLLNLPEIEERDPHFVCLPCP